MSNLVFLLSLLDEFMSLCWGHCIIAEFEHKKYLKVQFA